MAIIQSIIVTPLNPPVNAVVTLARAKKHLKVDATDEDDLIQDYIDSCIMAAENYASVHLHAKTYTQLQDRFDAFIMFEALPVNAVTSVEYKKAGEDTYTPLTVGTDYRVEVYNKKYTRIRIINTPTDAETPENASDVVKVVVSVGYSGASNVPKPFKQAVLLMLADAYERREDRKEIDTTAAQHLMRPYRSYI